jgi:hypothetical protein
MKADFPELDCDECEAGREPGEPEPDCEACPMVELSEENRRAMELHTMMKGAAELGLAGEVLGLAGPMSRDRARVLMLKLGMISAFEARTANTNHEHEAR